MGDLHLVYLINNSKLPENFKNNKYIIKDIKCISEVREDLIFRSIIKYSMLYYIIDNDKIYERNKIKSFENDINTLSISDKINIYVNSNLNEIKFTDYTLKNANIHKVLNSRKAAYIELGYNHSKYYKYVYIDEKVPNLKIGNIKERFDSLVDVFPYEILSNDENIINNNKINLDKYIEKWLKYIIDDIKLSSLLNLK